MADEGPVGGAPGRGPADTPQIVPSSIQSTKLDNTTAAFTKLIEGMAGDFKRLSKSLTDAQSGILVSTEKLKKEQDKLVREIGRSTDRVKDAFDEVADTAEEASKAQRANKAVRGVTRGLREAKSSFKAGDSDALNRMAKKAKSNASKLAETHPRLSKAMNTAAGGLGRMAQLARFGPAIGIAVAAMGKVFDKVKELNTFRVGNLRDFYNLGGTNVAENVAGAKGGITGFRARQYGYNRFRYNESIKYGLDASEMGQVFSGLTSSSGRSLEGMMGGVDTKGIESDKAEGLARKYGDFLGKTAENITRAATSMGMAHQELASDMGESMVEYGGSQEGLMDLYGDVAAQARKAGLNGKFYLDNVKKVSQAYSQMGGRLREISMSMSRGLKLGAGPQNQLVKQIQDILGIAAGVSQENAFKLIGILGPKFGEVQQQMLDKYKTMSKDTESYDLDTRRGFEAMANRIQENMKRGPGGQLANAALFRDMANEMPDLFLGVLDTISTSGGAEGLARMSISSQKFLEAIGIAGDEFKSLADHVNGLKLYVDGLTGAFGQLDEEAKKRVEGASDLTELSNILGLEGNLREKVESLPPEMLDEMKKVAQGKISLRQLADLNRGTGKGKGRLLGGESLDIQTELSGIEKQFGFTKDQAKFFASETGLAKITAAGVTKIAGVTQSMLRLMSNPGQGKDYVELEKLTDSYARSLDQGLTAARGMTDPEQIKKALMDSGVSEKDASWMLSKATTAKGEVSSDRLQAARGRIGEYLNDIMLEADNSASGALKSFQGVGFKGDRYLNQEERRILAEKERAYIDQYIGENVHAGQHLHARPGNDLGSQLAAEKEKWIADMANKPFLDETTAKVEAPKATAPRAPQVIGTANNSVVNNIDIELTRNGGESDQAFAKRVATEVLRQIGSPNNPQGTQTRETLGWNPAAGGM